MNAEHKKRFAAVAVIAAAAFLIVGVGAAAAYTSTSSSVGDDNASATTYHNYSFTADNTGGDAVSSIVITDNNASFSDVNVSNVTVIHNGSSQSVDGSKSSASADTLNVTLDSTVATTDGASEAFDVNVTDLTNPDASGTYDSNIDLHNTSGEAFSEGTVSYTITLGPIPELRPADSTVSDGSNISNYSGDSSEEETIQVDTESSNIELRFVHSSNENVTFEEFSTSAEVEEANDSSEGIYNFTFTHADLLSVPQDAGDNVTVYGEVDNLDDDLDARAFTFTIENDGSVTTRYVSSDAASVSDYEFSDDTEVYSKGFLGGYSTRDLWIRDAADFNRHTVSEDAVPIEGEDTEEVVYTFGSSEADAIDDALPDDPEAESFASGVTVSSEDPDSDVVLPREVYVDSAPDTTFADTYGVYDTSSERLTVTLGDGYSDTESIDVEATSHSTYTARDIPSLAEGMGYGNALDLWWSQ